MITCLAAYRDKQTTICTSCKQAHSSFIAKGHITLQGNTLALYQLQHATLYVKLTEHSLVLGELDLALFIKTLTSLFASVL